MITTMTTEANVDTSTKQETTPFCMDNGSSPWPNLYEEAYEMMVASTVMYLLARQRDFARQGLFVDKKQEESDKNEEDEDSNSLLLNQLVQLCPMVTFLDVLHVLELYSDTWTEQLGEERKDIDIDFLISYRDYCKQQQQEKDIEQQQLLHSKVVVFDDPSKNEAVWAIMVDDYRKRVTVAFRGTVTKSDTWADVKAYYKNVRNPAKDLENVATKLSKRITYHAGFYDYLFQSTNHAPSGAQKEEDDTARVEQDDHDDDAIPTKHEAAIAVQEETKFDLIRNKVIEILNQHPGYRLYVTGHSLGAALCTIFAFHAAMDPDIPKPVTCINFASPKVGAMDWRTAFQALEECGRLRCLRVANDNDPVTNVPRDILLMVPGDWAFAFLCLALKHRQLYRHVGMELRFFKRRSLRIMHPKLDGGCYCKVLASDWYRQIKRIFALIINFLCCLFCIENFRAYHGYPAYMNQLEANEDTLRQKKLNDLYEAFSKGDKKQVSPRYS